MGSRLDCNINSLFTNVGQAVATPLMRTPATTPRDTTAPPRSKTSYEAMNDKWCKGQNDLFESKLGVFKSADECKKKCSDNPKCVSAEWFASDPTQCDTSSTCTTKNMEDAPKNFGVVLFVKQAATNTGE